MIDFSLLLSSRKTMNLENSSTGPVMNVSSMKVNSQPYIRKLLQKA
jgi:hypothetical protein